MTFPDPLHPAIVHLPMALAILLPLFSVGWWLAIQKGWVAARTWAVVVALFGLLVVSSWVAVETGEEQEERVEAVVAESVLEEHEEAAEQFLVIAGVALLISGMGLLPGALGTGGRVAASAVSLVILIAGIQVGHAGGELVYRHGAAQAYLDSTVKSAYLDPSVYEAHEDHEDHVDHDEEDD